MNNHILVRLVRSHQKRFIVVACARSKSDADYTQMLLKDKEARGEEGGGGGVDDGGGCWLLFLFVCAGVRALRGMGRQAVRQNKNRKG